MSLFVARAVFNEVQVSLFVAGAIFGEIWNGSRSAKCCIFRYKLRLVNAKSNLSFAAGCGLTGSWSDHSWIGGALQMMFQLFSGNICHISDGHFSWQGQYLVMLEDDFCWSAHCT